MDLFIEMGTNGPQVVGQVEKSIQQITSALAGASGIELDFGRVDLTKLQQLERQLKEIASEAQRALSQVSQAERAQAAPGIYRQATAAAAPLLSSARAAGGLPAYQALGDLEKRFAGFLNNTLRQVGAGPGLGLQAAAPELLLSRNAAKAQRDKVLSAVDPEKGSAEQAGLEYQRLAASVAKEREVQEAASQKRGQIETQAQREMEAAHAAERAAEQRQGNMEERARRLMERDFAAREKAAEAAEKRATAEGFAGARTEGAAYREDEKRTRDAAKAAEELAAQRRETARVLRLEALRAGVGNGTFQRTGNKIVTPGGVFDTQGRRVTGFGADDAYARLAPAAGKGVVPSFFDGMFGVGFTSRGPADLQQGISNLARTAGQTAKFTLLYQALNGIQMAFSDTLKEARDFSEGVRDLDIAMAEAGPVSAQYLNQLTQISRTAGANPSAALEAAARGVRAFTDPSTASEDEVRRAGLAVADSANQISLITGKELKDATGDVVAIASAFGLAATESSKVVDAIVTARKLGGDPAQTSQGLAGVAQVAKEAGLGLQEAANAISLVSARVDESGQAAATRISRMLSILGGTTGRSIIDKINSQNVLDGAGNVLTVDPTAQAAEQLREIARVYEAAGKGGNTQLQGLIRNAFGAANARETQVIFDNADQIFGAETNLGAGKEQFKQRLDTLDGLLKLITGDLTNLQVQLVNTDIFAPFAAALKVAEVFLSTLNRVLELYNELTSVGPDWVKPIVTAAAEFALIARFLPLITASLGGISTKALTGLGLGSLLKGSLDDGAGAAGRGSVRGSVVSAAKGIGGFVAGNAPALAAAAVIGLYTSIQADVEEIDQIRGGAFDALKKAAQAGDFAGASESLTGASRALSGGGGLVGFATAEKRASQAQIFANQAELLRGYANEAEARAKLNRGLESASEFGDLASQSVDDFSGTLDSLKARGESSASTMRLLSQAIAGLLNPTQRKIDGAKIGAQSVIEAAANPGLASTEGLYSGGGFNGAVYSSTRLAELLGDTTRLDSAKRAIEQGVAARGGRALTDNDSLQIASSAADAMVAGLGLAPEDMAIIRRRYVQQFLKTIAGQDALIDKGPLTNEVAVAAAQAQVGFAQSVAGTQTGLQKIGTLRGLVRDVKRTRARAADTDLPELIEQQRVAESLLLNAQIDDAEALISALDQKGKPKAAKRLSNRRFAALIKKAINNGDSQAVMRLLEQATKDQINAQIAVIDLAIQKEKEASSLAAYAAFVASGYAKYGADSSKLKELQRQRAQFRQALNRTGTNDDSKGFGRSPLPDDAGSDKDTATDIANARRAAQVAGSRNPVEQARVEVINARASLRQEAAKGKNSVAYWNAVAAYRSAKKAYQDALREETLAQKDALQRLSIDLTDPVATAKAELDSARRKLRADRKAGAPKSQILNDEVDVKNAQAQAEAAKFQQRLSDMQIAEQLGRISHAAYIRYLQNEHDRLSAIKNRTRQQVDQLNEIDLELKNAMDALSGQFNLGDIKLPTVYQGRRQLVEQAGGSPVGTVTNVSINVDGADTGQILSLMSQYLGPVRAGSVTVTGRKI